MLKFYVVKANQGRRINLQSQIEDTSTVFTLIKLHANDSRLSQNEHHTPLTTSDGFIVNCNNWSDLDLNHGMRHDAKWLSHLKHEIWPSTSQPKHIYFHETTFWWSNVSFTASFSGYENMFLASKRWICIRTHHAHLSFFQEPISIQYAYNLNE